MIYDNLVKYKNNIMEIQNKVIYHFVNGPYIEIKGNKSKTYFLKIYARV